MGSPGPPETDAVLSLTAHDTGLVTLQVAFNNQIISNSVVFEYKARALPTLPSSQHDWLSLDGKGRPHGHGHLQGTGTWGRWEGAEVPGLCIRRDGVLGDGDGWG